MSEFIDGVVSLLKITAGLLLIPLLVVVMFFVIQFALPGIFTQLPAVAPIVAFIAFLGYAFWWKKR